MLFFFANFLLAAYVQAGGLGRCGSGNYQETIDDCSAAINSGTLNKKDLSMAYARLGSADEPYFEDREFAIANLNKAIQLDPTNVMAYLFRGMARLSKSDLEKVIELAPESGWADEAKYELERSYYK